MTEKAKQDAGNARTRAATASSNSSLEAGWASSTSRGTEGAQGFTRPVIVKRILADLASDEATARAFVREARILANLQHPGIVNVIDFNEEDGAYVMVLEYVHGYNLAQWHKYVVETAR